MIEMSVWVDLFQFCRALREPLAVAIKPFSERPSRFLDPLVDRGEQVQFPPASEVIDMSGQAQVDQGLMQQYHPP